MNKRILVVSFLLTQRYIANFILNLIIPVDFGFLKITHKQQHNKPHEMRSVTMWSTRRATSVATAASIFQNKRWNSSNSSSSPSAVETAPSHDTVWGLWNEGNLFSLTVAQMDAFLSANRVTPDGSRKKALLVRQLEELLQTKENSAKGLPPPQQAPPPVPTRGHGSWAPPPRPVSEPETLLDLTQSGFYESPHAMAPKAFQLLVNGATPDVVVGRVNTTAFPGFPANSECYTLSTADSTLSLRTRFSKAFQWCLMNLSNLRIDAEFQADFGKLLVHQSMIKKGRQVVSAYSFQQRIQTQTASTGSEWVSSVSEASVPAMEALLADELFTAVGKKQLSYDAQIRRANDVLFVELNSKAAVTAVNSKWNSVQTSHLLQQDSIDSRLMLRTRQPLRRQEVELFTTVPVLAIENGDVTPVLPAEHGQVVYVSENEVRRWEKRNTLSGARLTVVETRREPLIVVRDEEEDVRIEYQLMVSVPCTPTEKVDMRLLSLELYDLAKLFSDTLSDEFVKSYGCEPNPVTATTSYSTPAAVATASA
ncbi:transmembrane protein, putative [Bodo saltans]|uniref:Transmembrane protein, putative n=1 Tax=Bodo saltans TaxID=75058 RepID=A0A0S4IN88_BODSA|nr:transmembrane protein, putative [Bodo saltans]|eukprot:CUE80928.1 transmembrane protein, putative [Bodo saltans]